MAAAVARSCGPGSAKLCHGSVCACVAKPGFMCFASMVLAVMVGVWAGTGAQTRSLCALPWTMRVSTLLVRRCPNREIERDFRNTWRCVSFSHTAGVFILLPLPVGMCLSASESAALSLCNSVFKTSVRSHPLGTSRARCVSISYISVSYSSKLNETPRGTRYLGNG